MKQFVFGSVRVQLLSDGIVRVELGKDDFCDRETFFIPDLSGFADTAVDVRLEGSIIYFGEYALSVPSGSSLKGVTLFKNGERVYSYAKRRNVGELPPPDKTPEVFVVTDSTRILIPDGGYTYRGEIENSGYDVQENVREARVNGTAAEFAVTARSDVFPINTCDGAPDGDCVTVTAEKRRGDTLVFEIFV